MKIKRIDQTLPLPEYKTSGSAAFDLYSREEIVIPAKGWALAPSNIIMEIPHGQGLIISARSSLAKNYPGLILANGIGLIDSDYRGPKDEIKISLYNMTDKNITINRGDRIANAFLVKYERDMWNEIEEIENSDRGGFGSTGLR
ncbi:dUTP diphosphatase [Candidatus Woesearchaeota archaeon CG_4_10_14_0_2_um_filter_33_13]|nr:MAG: dUTP diphosphatase [Candidatus Woesearchaeota archaeon CG_4_10_14_0_2_um_filter_33_13]